jgi:hypothetical protein
MLNSSDPLAAFEEKMKKQMEFLGLKTAGEIKRREIDIGPLRAFIALPGELNRERAIEQFYVNALEDELGRRRGLQAWCRGHIGIPQLDNCASPNPPLST